MIIREVRRKDLSSLLALYRELEGNPVPEQGEKLEALWDRILADQSYHLLVAEVDKRIAASLTLVVVPNLTRNLRPYGLVENVVTHLKFRRQGLATALLERARALALEAGCYKVMLLTGSRDPVVHALYQRAGYNNRDKTGYVQWLDGREARN